MLWILDVTSVMLNGATTLNIIISVDHQLYLSFSTLIVNRMHSATNTKCKPDIICHAL